MIQNLCHSKNPIVSRSLEVPFVENYDNFQDFHFKSSNFPSKSKRRNDLVSPSLAIQTNPPIIYSIHRRICVCICILRAPNLRYLQMDFTRSNHSKNAKYI